MLHRLRAALSHPRPAHQAARRPLLEALEDRAVPATIYALYATTNQLAYVHTDGFVPNTSSLLSITGLQTTGESLLGIDFRPRTGQLIGTSADAAGRPCGPTPSTR